MEDDDIIIRRYHALMVLGIILPFLIFPFLSMVFLSASQSDAYRFIFSRFLIWAELGLVLLYARYGEVQRFFLWDEERYDFGFFLKWIIALYLLVMACGIAASIPHWLGLHERNDVSNRMLKTMRLYPLSIVFAAFTAGVTEEFIFRGYIISRLSLLLKNKHLPVIISALLFMCIHLGYKNIGELIFTFLFGVVFGYHYQKYRNIMVLVTVHALWDFLAMFAAIHHK